MAYKILIVDDEASYAESIAERLSLRDFDADAVYSGEEALEYARKTPPEVVVLDLAMPGLGGLETLQKLKERYGDSVEVLILTGDSTMPSAIEGMKRGAFDYLLKPIDIAKLIQALTQAHKRRAKNLERMRMIETGRLASLASMAMGVAHEINNPLNIMVNEAGWIRDLVQERSFSETDVEEILGSIATIDSQAKRCKEITTRLLSIRRPTRPESDKTSLDALIKEVLQNFAGRFEDQRVEIITDFNQEITSRPVPAIELREVFASIIENALDAMPDGGKLLISTGQEADNLVIEYSDTGPGIAADQLPHLFEPFFSTKAIGHGNGLGLSISQSVMHNLGGSIDIHSRSGEGTTVRLTLPDKF